MDQSAKASAVYAAAAQTGVISGGVSGVGYQFGQYGGLSVQHGILNASIAVNNMVARALAPPAPPVLASAWGAGPVLLLLALILVGLACLASMQTLIVTLACAAFAVWLIVARRKEDERRRAAYQVELPRWQRAMQNYDALYYCGRCDGVFLPGRPEIYRTAETIYVVYN